MILGVSLINNTKLKKRLSRDNNLAQIQMNKGEGDINKSLYLVTAFAIILVIFASALVYLSNLKIDFTGAAIRSSTLNITTNEIANSSSLNVALEKINFAGRAVWDKTTSLTAQYPLYLYGLIVVVLLLIMILIILKIIKLRKRKPEIIRKETFSLPEFEEENKPLKEWSTNKKLYLEDEIDILNQHLKGMKKKTPEHLHKKIITKKSYETVKKSFVSHPTKVQSKPIILKPSARKVALDQELAALEEELFKLDQYDLPKVKVKESLTEDKNYDKNNLDFRRLEEKNPTILGEQKVREQKSSKHKKYEELEELERKLKQELKKK